ncbi:MAG: putative quinol monooxygenase [Chloroflexota bacterium]
MILQLVTIPVQPDKKDYFLEEFAKAQKPSLEEAGVTLYYATVEAANPNTVVLVEEYADQAALDSHLEEPFIKAFIEVIGECAAGEVVLRVYDGTMRT